MSAAVGFIMIIVIVALLLKGKMSPIVVLVVVPSIAALILGNNPIAVADMIKEGVTTTSNGILFIFSVIYFGVLSDTGLFDIIVNWLVKMAGSNVIAVTVATAIVATIAHLDGTTATTVLITIPALYPVYKRMKIDPKILLCLTGACMGVMNLLPWGGPTARAATVLQMDANELWHILIPVQIIGVIFNIVLAVLLGMLAVRQYMRETMAGCGKMILGSDSHTRYGALGTMAIGEGGGELGKQLLQDTYDVAYPGVVAIYLDGSAREQAASCQRVIGGLANITQEYATKRYRSNVMNWGMIPFHMKGEPKDFEVGDYIYVPGIRKALDGDLSDIKGYVINDGKATQIDLYILDMTKNEREIVKAGCLINFNKNRRAAK